MLSKIFLILEFMARMTKIIGEWKRLEEKKRAMNELTQAYKKAKESGSTKGLSQWLNSR